QARRVRSHADFQGPREGRQKGPSSLTSGQHGSTSRHPEESRTAMEAKAQVRYLRMSPMKARRVVDLIRGKSTAEALDILRFAPQGASAPVLKLVESAIANARVKADQAGSASMSASSPSP